MDPFAFALATYLNTVQSTLNNHIQTNMDLDVKSLTIQYGGQPVSFQHQLWKVKPKSVCNNARSSITAYSDCTRDASLLFIRLCREFTASGSEHPLQRKYTNMYCNASTTFKPTIASLKTGSVDNEITAAKKACNSATVAAMGSVDRHLRMERDKLCLEYRKFSAQ